MGRNYLMLLLVSAVLVAPACSKTDKTSLMAATAAGAVVSSVGGAIHFFGNKLGIRSNRPASSAGAEVRANKGPVFTKKTVLLKKRAAKKKHASK